MKNTKKQTAKATDKKKPKAVHAQTDKADNADVTELLREVIKGIDVVAQRIESVRRTLWRIGEVRAYNKDGDKGAKDTLRELVADTFTPLVEEAMKGDGWADFCKSFVAGGNADAAQTCNKGKGGNK